MTDMAMENIASILVSLMI